jgi:predicted site-specific integrase-resolvase
LSDKQYKVKDVANATGISTSTVNGWLKNNMFPASRAPNGRTYLIDAKTYKELCAYAKTRVGNPKNVSTKRKSITIKRDTKSTGSARKWPTVQDQIDATMAGDIVPIYLDRQGDVITNDEQT